ncbi:MAG TPA: sigma-70 family RNA polymerase sigma factor [Deltaproteobacteria bacterium]|nr:sigma-70 family RNA polymerase sigma factor [Deltaproteobacteria bacterium]HQI02338.1 sigma-70 family RNA polymerase sigma factor [Deltaproteobacteria bacterium]HQJ09812.1 sigma-70 family RNA polymerase sigma factor [Deltaproteobacteria bacterium]
MRRKNLPYELSLYAKRVNEFEYLHLEEELELARRYRSGDLEAGRTLISANLRFALKISSYYFQSGHNPMEIVQEGNMGLMKALEKFDPDRGFKFFSYAIWWVHACIREFIYKDSKKALGFASGLFPLDSALSDDSDECFVDSIQDDSPGQEELFFSSQKRELLLKFLSPDHRLLTDREKYILKRRYFEEPTPTLRQIAKKLKITKERVRQLQIKSLDIIHDYMVKEHSMRRDDFMGTDHDPMLGIGVFSALRA